MQRWFFRNPRPRPHRRRATPRVEALEDRCVPAAFLVNTLADTVDDDPAVTSLREAIAAANGQAGDDVITFAAGVTGTIQLGRELPHLNSNMAFQGPGAGVLTVRRDTGGDYRIFWVILNANVTFSGLTISNGIDELRGGGIRNDGTLALTDVTLSGNSSGMWGGGIYNHALGTLTMTGCTLSDNASAQSGGGIRNDGKLTMTGCTFSGNQANEAGGGIHNAGTLTLSNSTLSANVAGTNNVFDAGGGGGICNSGTLALSHSTLYGNQADNGGGICNSGLGTLTLSNSTLSANSSKDGGGGIYNSGDATLTHATLTSNRADSDNDGFGAGGGISFSGPHTLKLSSTIVAGNFRGFGTDRDDVAGTVAATSSFNLVGDGTGLTGITHGVNGNQVGTALAPIDPLLGPLQDNGGPTRTHALLPGSPGIDGGHAAAGATTDQRGLGRTVDQPDVANSAGGDGTDIGAFEVPPPPAPAVSVSPSNLTFSRQQIGTPSAVQTVTVTNSGTAPLHLTAVTLGGANAADFARTISNMLPITVSPSASFTIDVTFTPNALGLRTGTVTVISDAGNSPQFTINLAGTGAAFVINAATLPDGTAGTAFGQTLTTSGGVGAVTFAVTAGALPAGLTLSAEGLLSGTPMMVGTLAFTVTATDASHLKASQAFFLTITPRVDPPTPPPSARGIVAALVTNKAGKTRRLFIRVSFADTGELKAELRSPFQKPAFRSIAVTAFDSDGDGAADTVRVTARKGKKTLTRFLSA